MCQTHAWRPEDNLQEPVLIHRVRSGSSSGHLTWWQALLPADPWFSSSIRASLVFMVTAIGIPKQKSLLNNVWGNSLHFILDRGFYFSPLVHDPLPIIFKCLYNAMLDWGQCFPVTVQLMGQPGMLVSTACCTAVVFVINQQVGEGWLPGPALLSTGLFDCSCVNHLGLYWLLKAHPQA